MFALAWMIFGVAFYSYAIGAMTTFIQAKDKQKELLNHKLSVLKEYRLARNMPVNLYLKVRRHL